MTAESPLDAVDPDLNYCDGDLNQSDYVTVGDYCNILQENSKNILSIVSYNIRSFNANNESFLGIFGNDRPDIIILSETWF